MTPQQQFLKLNECLSHLAALFRKAGISEFKVSRDAKSITWDTGSSEVDVEVIDALCESMGRIVSCHKKGSISNN